MGFLDPKILNEISEPLRVLYEKEGIDVIVVVLNDIGTSPPEHVAGRFADAWCNSMFHCVVLHVPGRNDGPWIIPGGRVIKQRKLEDIKKFVTDAKRRVSSESSEAGKVKASATEATDMLRFWMGDEINRSEMIQRQGELFRKNHEQRKRDQKLAIITIAACVIPLIFGAAYLMIVLRNRAPRIFPDSTTHPRLGAPHAGGTHAVVDLGPPIH